MSTPNEDEHEIIVDPNEKSDYRRGRRASVQFIDKNLIRRRSSGNEKQAQPPSRLILGSTIESDDRDHLQNYSEIFFVPFIFDPSARFPDRSVHISVFFQQRQVTAIVTMKKLAGIYAKYRMFVFIFYFSPLIFSLCRTVSVEKFI